MNEAPCATVAIMGVILTVSMIIPASAWLVSWLVEVWCRARDLDKLSRRMAPKGRWWDER